MNTTETLRKAYETGQTPHQFADSRDELNYACDYYAVRGRMSHKEAIEHADAQAKKFNSPILARETEQESQEQPKTLKSAVENLDEKARYEADREWVFQGGALGDYRKQEAIELGLSFEQWKAQSA